MLLLVEDNELIIKGLVYFLAQNNYQVVVAKTIKEARLVLENSKIRLIILDVMLPDGNGMDFYEQLTSKIPTILLTAKDDEDFIASSFDLGIDDYLTKPFRNKELLARIKKIIKTQNDIITIKDITLDCDKRLLYKNGKEISLTSLEFSLLLLLFKNVNRVVTREVIMDKIWELTGNDVNDNTVTVYLKRIREKLDSDIIVTIKGVGYRIDGE